MIQRIQTVFLLLAGLAMLIFLFAPIWKKQEINTGASYTQTAFYMEKVSISEEGVENTFIPYAISGILGVISVCISFITIGLYKKRMKQIILCAINSIIIGLALGLSAYWASQAESSILRDMQGGYQYGLFLPAIAIIFNSLAGRFIRKDERLVRSMDRLR